MRAITLLETISPETVGKTYTLDASGKLKKHTSANVYRGRATTIQVPDAATMVKILTAVTTSNKLVLLNGVFRGAGDDEIEIRTAAEFKQIVEADGGNFDAVLAKGEVYTLTKGPKKGHKFAARLQALMEPSSWLLIDADEPVGFPDAWRPLSFQQRLALLEPVAPGLSKAERVELRGSSARVIKEGGQPGEPSHGWIMVDDAGDLPRAAAALQLHATNAGISFRSPRYSRTTGEEIGGQERTSIDLAPWHRGRLNFDSQPTVKAKGYKLADAGIRIVNPGGGAFKATSVAAITPKVRSDFTAKTGIDLLVTAKGANVQQVVSGMLTMETLIEVKGVEKPLSDWVEYMFEHELNKLRCEAPFRASNSEAAFVSFERDGRPFVYDIGSRTNYSLPGRGPLDDFDFIDDDEGAGEDATPPAPADEFSVLGDPEVGLADGGEDEPAQEHDASEAEAWAQEDEEAAEEGAGGTFPTFDAAIEALKADKTNRAALDAALRFYSAMEPIEQALAEDRLSSASGHSRRTLRSAGAALREAENMAESWTHSEIAHDFLKVLRRKALMPVANAGGLYIYAKESGTWKRKEPVEVRKTIGQRYRKSDNCKKHGDYAGVTHTLMAEVMDEGFFTSALPGIATQSSFWRANFTEQKVERLEHHHTNRARFAVAFEPVFDKEPVEFLRTLRQAFVAPPDVPALAAAHGYTGNIKQWPTAAPKVYAAALEADKTEQEARADEQIELLRQMMGATLLGFQHRLQVAVMLFGAGNSFKSACLRILCSLFEPQAVTSIAPTELDSDYKKAALAHKRLNCVPELDADTPIPAAAYKSALGGDSLIGREPYGLPFTFTNEAAFWTAGNHFPTTRDQTDAFFRRWVIIHFKVGRKREEVDLGLEPRIVANELPAIAGWALKGAEILLKNGQKPVLSRDHHAVMAQWREENNSIASWLSDSPSDSGVAPAQPGSTPITLSIAYSQYRSWCMQAGRKPYGRNHFREELVRLGHPSRRTSQNYTEFPTLRMS